MESKDWQEIREMPGNDRCVDCDAKDPEWACLTYGTLLCINCAGAHRSFGTHLSFIRSATLDTWTPDQIERMKHGGNAKLAKLIDEYNYGDKTIYQRYTSRELLDYAHVLEKEAPLEKATPVIEYDKLHELEDDDDADDDVPSIHAVGSNSPQKPQKEKKSILKYIFCCC